LARRQFLANAAIAASRAASWGCDSSWWPKSKAR
jgi:hypothetical protein